jgi:hypothetical protein
MTKEKKLRIDDKLAEKLETDAKQKNISENEWLTQATQHYLECKKADESGNMKLIVLRYDGHCLKCGEKVEHGNWALYGRGVGIICMDCYVGKIGDRALIAKYLKMREYEKIKKALQNEVERLADKVEVFQAGEKLQALSEQWEKLTKLVQDYLTTGLGRPEEKELFEEIIREKVITEALIRDVEDFIKRYVQTRKWTKKTQKTESYQT